MNWLTKFFNPNTIKVNKYIKWAETVSMKYEDLYNFISLSNPDDVIKFDSESLSIVSELATLLGEWKELPNLPEDREKYVVQLLLKDIVNIFKVLSKKICTKRDLCYILILIVSLLTRPEFDIQRDKINSPSHLRKYKLYCSVVEKLLFLIILKLESIINVEEFNSIVVINPHYIAYAKVLSTLYFRLPFAGNLMLSSIKSEDIAELRRNLHNFDKPKTSRANKKRIKQHSIKKMGKLDVNDFGFTTKNTVADKRAAYKNYIKKKREKTITTQERNVIIETEKTESQFSASKIEELKTILRNARIIKDYDLDNVNTFPFICWEYLYATAPSKTTLSDLSLKWLLKIKDGKSIIFVLFFQEWISHIKTSILKYNKDAHIEWKNILGYSDMELIFLTRLKEIDPHKLSDVMMSCTCELLSCNIDLIDFYIKYVYKNTNVFNRGLVVDTFNKIKMWMKEIEKLGKYIPKSFDIDFFCKGLDIIIQTDRYDLLIQIISLFYEYAHLFCGDIRMKLLLDFVLNKHFNTLFLHWNVLIRNYFMHFLVYKLVRIRISDIDNYGFDYNPPEDELVLNEYGYFVKSPPEELAIDIKIHCVMLAKIKILEDELESNTPSSVYVKIAINEYNHIYSQHNPNENPPNVEASLREKLFKSINSSNP